MTKEVNKILLKFDAKNSILIVDKKSKENIEKARDEFKKLVFDEDFSDFLTLPAYHLIN